MGQIELKPCPNPDCNGNPRDIETDGTQWVGGQSLYLACEGCGTRGPWCDTEQEATVAWNRLPRVGDGAIDINDGEVREDIYFDGITLEEAITEALNKSFEATAKGTGLPKTISGKVELEPAVVDDDSLVAMHQQYDDEKWDDVHKKINGYGKVVKDLVTIPNSAFKPVDKDRFPHICTLCDAPAYLAGEGGYSECSNPDCELS